jgi:hypothetical protein
MTKNIFGNLGLTSVLIATALVGFDAQLAMACSRGSGGSGLSHGSSLGSGSVTVCVGSSGGSSGSTSTQTVTKTVRVKVPVKTKKAPAPKKTPKVTSKPAPKIVAAPVVVSCPSPSRLASMPRSADAAERWVSGICSPASSAPTAAKPAQEAASKPKPKPKPRPKERYQLRTITEVINIETPGSYFATNDAVDFYPNPLKAFVAPESVLGIGQPASFSSNAHSHFGISQVLGRQAQVNFVPLASGWIFSDGTALGGADASRSFSSAGKHQATAWVDYEVSYRLLGETSWEPVAGQLRVNSDTLEILVGALFLKGDEASQGALLVGDDCRARANSFGCGI